MSERRAGGLAFFFAMCILRAIPPLCCGGRLSFDVRHRMTPQDFAHLCHAYKDDLVATYFDEGSETQVRMLIDEVGLSEDQLAHLRRVLDAALADCLYGLLLGIDGCASVAGKQITCRLTDEDGGLLAGGGGELEAAAFEAFHVKGA